MRFFFASRMGNIKKVRARSLLSSEPHIIYNLNRYDFKSGKVWSKNDLEVGYNFGKEIKFKKDKIPDGHPYLYSGVIPNESVEADDQFPKLFKNKKEVVVNKVNSREYVDLICSRRHFDFTNFN